MTEEGLWFFRFSLRNVFQLREYSAAEYSVCPGTERPKKTADSALWDLHARSWTTPRAPCRLWTQRRRGHLSLPPPPSPSQKIQSARSTTISAPLQAAAGSGSEDGLYLQLPDRILHNFCAFWSFDLCASQELETKRREDLSWCWRSGKHLAPSPSSSRGRCFPPEEGFLPARMECEKTQRWAENAASRLKQDGSTPRSESRASLDQLY